VPRLKIKAGIKIDQEPDQKRETDLEKEQPLKKGKKPILQEILLSKKQKKKKRLEMMMKNNQQRNKKLKTNRHSNLIRPFGWFS